MEYSKPWFPLAGQYATKRIFKCKSRERPQSVWKSCWRRRDASTKTEVVFLVCQTQVGDELAMLLGTENYMYMTFLFIIEVKKWRGGYNKAHVNSDINTARFSFHFPFCVLLNQRENLILDQGSLKTLYHSPDHLHVTVKNRGNWIFFLLLLPWNERLKRRRLLVELF